jgi:hypothetical protein
LFLGAAANEEFFSRSLLSFSKSISAISICELKLNLSPSFKRIPFSAISKLPEKHKSVEDSPAPAEEYIYADRVRAD